MQSNWHVSHQAPGIWYHARCVRVGGTPLYEHCAIVGLTHFIGWAKATLRLNYRIIKGADGEILRRFLCRLRNGVLDSADIEQLSTRVAGCNGTPSLEELGDYQVLALRHDVIEHIVGPLVRRLARVAKQQLVVWYARDSAATLRTMDGRAPALQSTGYFFKGMRALACSTIDVENGVVNNAPLEMVSLQPDPRDLPLPRARDVPVVVLKFLPISVHVQAPDHGVVSIAPVERPTRQGKMRRQLPYRPAVVITDYCAQGATFDRDRRVVVDISRPPTGSLSYHALYVTLSRFRLWSQVVLMRAILADATRPLKRAADIAYYVKVAVPPANVVAAQWWIEHPAASVNEPQSELVLLLSDVRSLAEAARKAYGRAVRLLPPAGSAR